MSTSYKILALQAVAKHYTYCLAHLTALSIYTKTNG